MRFLLIMHPTARMHNAREHRGRCHLPWGGVEGLGAASREKGSPRSSGKTLWAEDTAQGKVSCGKWHRGELIWIECGGDTQEMKLQGSESDSGETDCHTEQCGRYELCGDTCQEVSVSD